MDYPDSNNHKKRKNEDNQYLKLQIYPQSQPPIPLSPDHNKFGPTEIHPETIQDIKKGQILGKGSYGTVYKATLGGVEVAVKIPLKQNLTPEEMESFRNEVRLMSKNTHPNVVLLMGACNDEGSLGIVTELCKTDLESLLQDQSTDLNLYQRVRMAREAAAGMHWLHDITKTIHRDLKPANLLIDYHGTVKVSDFGFCQVKTEGLITDKPKGSLVWMAPEVMLGKPYNEKIDVYSFGIILWEIVTKQKPFLNYKTAEEFSRSICFKDERPTIPEGIPDTLKHIMRRCWDRDPNQRYSFSKVVFRLSEVMVELAVEDPDACYVWKKYFLLDEQKLYERVTWEQFEMCLRQEEHGLPRDSRYLYNLKQTIVSTVEETGQQKEYVTMEKFDKVVKWFGPFYHPIKGPEIIDEINKLCSMPWFHGELSSSQATARISRYLSNKPSSASTGIFLVRLSTTDPKRAPFSITLSGDEHARVEREGEYGLKFYDTYFSNLYELVQSYEHVLQTPCPKEYSVVYNNAAGSNKFLQQLQPQPMDTTVAHAISQYQIPDLH